jgi:hypothetical protein
VIGWKVCATSGPSIAYAIARLTGALVYNDALRETRMMIAAAMPAGADFVMRDEIGSVRVVIENLCLLATHFHSPF